MISIIIPALNEEKYIKKLLESINRQDNRNFEVIIVDASEDRKTQEAVRKFGKLKPRIFRSKIKNPGYQKNLGAKMAKGTVLLFMDADITIPKRDFLRKIDELFRNKRIAGATTRMKVSPAQEELQDVVFQWLFNTKIWIVNKLNIGFARGGCQIVRKTAFEKVNGFNEKIVISEDFELHRKVARVGGLYFFNNLVVYESPRRYRQYGYLRLMWMWTVNGLFGIFARRSLVKKLEPVR